MSTIPPQYNALDRVPEEQHAEAQEKLDALRDAAIALNTQLQLMENEWNVTTDNDPVVIELREKLDERIAELESDPKFIATRESYEKQQDKVREARDALKQALIDWRTTYDNVPSPLPGLQTRVSTRPEVEDEQGLIAWARANMPVCLTVDKDWIKPLFEMRELAPELNLYIGETRNVTAVINDVSTYTDSE